MEVVWLTSLKAGLPHREEFTAANPNVIQHRCDSPDGIDDERILFWRNCDRNIRNWWKINHHRILGDHVVFLEWDVVCNVPIEKIFRPQNGLVGSELKTQPQDSHDWLWFKELNELPPEMRSTAIGLVPLAAIQLSRAALDAISDDRHDALYESDIFCELRTPSLLRHLGFPIESTSTLKHVTWQPMPYPWLRRGIFHPIKKARRDHWPFRLMNRHREP